MAKKMVKLKDVAKMANVSMATASRILHNDKTLSVTEETKNAVLNAAQELQYVVKHKSVRMIVAVVQWYSLDEEINDPYYLNLRVGVEKFLKSHQIGVNRIFSDDVNMEQSLSNASGIICLGKFSDEHINRLKTFCNKIILLDMDFNPVTETCIVLDFDNALNQVVSYLHYLGHKKIGFLGGIEYTNNEVYTDPRRLYFEKYCELKQIDYKEYIKEGQFTSESGYQMMTEMIYSQQLPDAVFCASDPIAMGALRSLHDHNIRVPEDISIIGFNNIEASNYTVPPLTTIHAPALEMGELGAKLLYYTLVNDDILPPMRIQVPCYFIERESCQTKEK